MPDSDQSTREKLGVVWRTQMQFRDVVPRHDSLSSSHPSKSMRSFSLSQGVVTPSDT
jgi:hypothetical protein